MSGQKPVVVGTDGSKHAQAAVRWAAQHAARHGAPLLIASAASAPVAYGMGGHLPQDFFDALKEEGGRIVDESTEIAREVAPDLEITGDVVIDATGPALLRLSETAEILVVGTRGLGGIASAFMGSVSSLIARHSSCPVVVVRGAGQDAAAPASGPVIVGIDGSEAALRALDRALEEARARSAPVRLIGAYPVAIVRIGSEVGSEEPPAGSTVTPRTAPSPRSGTSARVRPSSTGRTPAETTSSPWVSQSW